jgi:hypothetical protein
MKKRSSSDGQQRKPAQTAVHRVQREKRRKESRRDEDWLHVNLVHPSHVLLCCVWKSLPALGNHADIYNGAFAPAITARSLKPTSGVQNCCKILLQNV